MAALTSALAKAEGAVHQAVSDVRGCGVALLVRNWLQRSAAPLVVIVPTAREAQLLSNDLQFTLNAPASAYTHSLTSPVAVMAGPPFKPYAQQLPDRRAAHCRLVNLLRLHPLRRASNNIEISLTRARVI
ncbi:MAG TPA: hypothetical protein ENK23_05720, partial [Sorangium sp.]|nr:hypothetical protein [Sorangium sp.]